MGTMHHLDMFDRPGEQVHRHTRPMNQLRAAFRKYDLDASGDIDPDELKLALEDLGLTDLDEEGTLQILQEFDDNHDGGTSLDEVKIALAKLSTVVAECAATESAQAKSVRDAKRLAREAQEDSQAAVDKVPALAKYLKARFTLSKRDAPHKMKF